MPRMAFFFVAALILFILIVFGVRTLVSFNDKSKHDYNDAGQFFCYMPRVFSYTSDTGSDKIIKKAIQEYEQGLLRAITYYESFVSAFAADFPKLENLRGFINHSNEELARAWEENVATMRSILQPYEAIVALPPPFCSSYYDGKADNSSESFLNDPNLKKPDGFSYDSLDQVALAGTPLF